MNRLKFVFLLMVPLLSGCLLDGFLFREGYQPGPPGTAQPVGHLRSFQIGTGTRSDPLMYTRFVQVGSGRYFMEQFPSKDGQADLVVLEANFVALEAGWYVLNWQTPQSPVDHGAMLVRFDGDGMAVAAVSKLEPSTLQRLAASSGISEPPRTLDSGGVRLSVADPARFAALARAIVRLPNLPTQALAGVPAVPMAVRKEGFAKVEEFFASISVYDVGDPAKAADYGNYFRALHADGLGVGSYAYARFATNGWGMARDTKLARELANKAVALGVVRANAILGLLAENGFDEPKNPAKALKHFELAADAGDGIASYRMGWAHAEGTLGVRKDPAAAARWFEVAQKAGHLDAQVRLAELLLDGEGIERDDARAEQLLNKPIYVGHPRAMSVRAFMHAHGRAGPVDDAKATSLYAQAAKAGWPYAQWQLGERLAAGTGAPVDKAKALEWLRLASKAGFTEADDAIKRIESEPATAGGLSKRDLATASSTVKEMIAELEREQEVTEQEIIALEKQSAASSARLHKSRTEMRVLTRRYADLADTLRRMETAQVEGLALTDRLLALPLSVVQRLNALNQQAKEVRDLSKTRADLAALEAKYAEGVALRLPNGQLVVTKPDGHRIALGLRSGTAYDPAALPRSGDQMLQWDRVSMLLPYEKSWTGVFSTAPRLSQLTSDFNRSRGEFQCNSTTFERKSTPRHSPSLAVDIHGVMRLRERYAAPGSKDFNEREMFARLDRLASVVVARTGQCHMVEMRCRDGVHCAVSVHQKEAENVSTADTVRYFYGDATAAERGASLLREIVRISP